MRCAKTDRQTDIQQPPVHVCSCGACPVVRAGACSGCWSQDAVTAGVSLLDDQLELLELAFNLFILMYQLYTFSDNENLVNALRSCSGYDYFKSLLGVVEIARGARPPCTTGPVSAPAPALGTRLLPECLFLPEPPLRAFRGSQGRLLPPRGGGWERGCDVATWYVGCRGAGGAGGCAQPTRTYGGVGSVSEACFSALLGSTHSRT